jgi:DNA processing protein
MEASHQGAGSTGCGFHTLSPGDPDYPHLLKQIHDPPDRLFVSGDPAYLSYPQVALVGSRRASPAGLRTAGELAAALTAAGLAVCSGLALGIDGAGHRGAIDAGGRTVAVLGTGIDRVYPTRHHALARAVRENGCLVSEFPPGTPARRHNFPRRNRLISGLSLGVVVVEAAFPSGSLITANAALEQGREVFALPWSALHKGGRGCLELLRDGAKLVRDVDDILEELAPLTAVLRSQLPDSGGAPGGDSTLLELVGFEAVSADELRQVSGLSVSELASQLTSLELEGLICRCPGGYIRR